MKNLLLAAALLFVSACITSEPDAERTLRSAGFTDITIGDWSFFGCSEQDAKGRQFAAKNAAGQPVSGLVCCGGGLGLKGCTVRF